MARFIDVYRDRIAEESRPFEGLDAALDRPRDDGAILCVCTNKPTGLSNLLLGQAEPRTAVRLGDGRRHRPAAQTATPATSSSQRSEQAGGDPLAGDHGRRQRDRRR